MAISNRFVRFPFTMLHLLDSFGVSLSLNGARRISHLTVSGSRYVPTGSKTGKVESHYFVDIHMDTVCGKNSQIIRSKTTLTRRQARDLHRHATRKIAMYLFENRNKSICNSSNP